MSALNESDRSLERGEAVPSRLGGTPPVTREARCHESQAQERSEQEGDPGRFQPAVSTGAASDPDVRGGTFLERTYLGGRQAMDAILVLQAGVATIYLAISGFQKGLFYMCIPLWVMGFLGALALGLRGCRAHGHRRYLDDPLVRCLPYPVRVGQPFAVRVSLVARQRLDLDRIVLRLVRADWTRTVYEGGETGSFRKGLIIDHALAERLSLGWGDCFEVCRTVMLPDAPGAWPEPTTDNEVERWSNWHIEVECLFPSGKAARYAYSLKGEAERDRGSAKEPSCM